MEPSMTDLKSTPSSSTIAMRLRFSARISLSVSPAVSMARTFLKPTPRLITWKPPESV